MASKKVKFLEWDCIVELHQYSNGRTAIELVEAETGEPVCRATVNVPDEDLKSGAVFENVAIKNYSENEGILSVLIEAGVIGTPNGFTFQGFPICKLLIAK